VAAATANGAIYQAGYDIPLFENAVARRVGDMRDDPAAGEHQRVRRVPAPRRRRARKCRMGGPTLGGRPVTVNGAEVLSGGIENERSFDGRARAARATA
jgi:flagellar L-ring protein FlgH